MNQHTEVSLGDGSRLGDIWTPPFEFHILQMMRIENRILMKIKKREESYIGVWAIFYQGGQ